MAATAMTQAYMEITQQTDLANYFKGAFYREIVPEEITGSEVLEQHLPLMRLNDIDSRDTGYASNRARFTNNLIQLSIWAGDFEQLDEANELLNNTMPAMGYTCTFTTSTYDPDVNTPMLVKRYEYEKDI